MTVSKDRLAETVGEIHQRFSETFHLASAAPTIVIKSRRLVFIGPVVQIRATITCHFANGIYKIMTLWRRHHDLSAYWDITHVIWSGEVDGSLFQFEFDPTLDWFEPLAFPFTALGIRERSVEYTQQQYLAHINGFFANHPFRSG